MDMIEIFIHIHPYDDCRFEKVNIPILFPFVPRIGETIILSVEQKGKIISLIEKKERGNWKDSIDKFTFVEEVSYLTKDNTIHIQLSNNQLN